MTKKILIIEDDKSISELERDYLEIDGFSVDICNDGVEGLKALETNGYSLAILDVMLPKMDGYEVLRQIRGKIDIPILLVSAKREDVDKIRGFGLGADDYITKPFSPSELVARVKSQIAKYERLINKNEAHLNIEIINVRGLEIQKDSRRVFINGKEINLAQKEFDLLLHMAQKPNRVFSKDELFEKIWGLDAIGDVATVTVHISRVREKIEADISNPQYIETVWGAGYRFKV